MLTGLPALIRLVWGEGTGIDVGVGVLVSAVFSAYYNGIAPYHNSFDLVSMRPTQYLISIILACGVMKQYSVGLTLTDNVITILVIGSTAPVLLFLILRLIAPGLGDRFVQVAMLQRNGRLRRRLFKQVKECDIKEGQHVIKEGYVS